MELKEIRQQILTLLDYDLSYWDDVINNTNPGNYGIEDWDVSISDTNFYVDIPHKKFSFSEVIFSAKLLLGGSNEDSSITEDFSTVVAGTGTFEFVTNTKVEIVTVKINPNVDLDIYK